MMLALGFWTAMACVPVERDRVLARDLAPVSTAIAAWPPDTELGYAPAPGLRRLFHAAELERLARRLNTETGPMSDVCVERLAAPLTPEMLQAALALELGDPNARVQLLDWSRYPVPHGSLEFPRTGAVAEGSGAQAPVLWKGFVQYGERARLSIWVRARIEAAASEVRAVEPLAAGHVIRAEQLRLEAVVRSPFGPQPAATLAAVAGRLPRRPIAAGSPIYANQLNLPPDVHSGDAVIVRVRSGQAFLKLEAIAAADGRRGDLIPVKNPSTGRTFRARVEGAGEAAVTVPGGVRPPGED